MENVNTITIIVSSGLVSIIVTLLTLVFSCGKYKQKVDSLETEKDKIQVSLVTFHTDITTLKEFRIQAQKFIDSKIYKASSALSLTDFGKELVTKSGFSSIFEIEKDNLKLLLERKAPVTKYDVQEFARELMDNLKDYPAFYPIKTYAYTTGSDFGQILRAGSILLRDYYLSRHPEIIN